MTERAMMSASECYKNAKELAEEAAKASRETDRTMLRATALRRSIMANEAAKTSRDSARTTLTATALHRIILSEHAKVSR